MHLKRKGASTTMIIDLDKFKADENFKNNIIPLMKKTNTPFTFYKEEFESLVILEKQPLFFVFLTFVPTGHHTHLPTLDQSMKNEQGEPRESEGEWVVDTIFQTREKDAKTIFTKLEDEPENTDVISFIRDELYRF